MRYNYNIKTLLAISVILLFTISCRIPDLQPEKVGGNISGTIRDANTGEIMAGVKVEIIGTGHTRYTDDKGTFSVENVSIGLQSLRIRAVNYQTNIQTVTFVSKAKIEINVYMEGLSIIPLPTDALILYLPFIGNPIDISENNRKVDINNIFLEKDKFKTFRNAYQFNGSDSFIQTSINLNTYEELSICVWFADARETYGEPVPILASDDGSFWIGKNNTNNRLSIYDGEYTSIKFNNINPWDNQWHHICYVKGSNEALIYLDNLSESIAVNSLITGNILIGNDNVQNSISFNGTIDEVVFYEKKISPEEVVIINKYYKDNEDTDQLFTGNWRGSFMTDENITTDVHLYLGENWFPIKYSFPDCESELFLISQNKNKMEFKEGLNNNKKCLNNELLILEKISDTQLTYSLRDGKGNSSSTTITFFELEPIP